MSAYEQNPLKKEIHSRLIRDIVRNLLLMGLGVLMLFFPKFSSRAVAVVLGWVLVAVGAVSILTALLKWKVLGLVQLLLGVALTGFGVYVLLVPGGLGSIFGIAVGIYLLFNGLMQAIAGFRPKAAGGSVVMGILGIVMVGLGIALFVAPKTAVQVIMLVGGIALLVSGVFAIGLRIFLLSKLKKMPSLIVDAQQ